MALVGSARQTQGFADVFGGRFFNTIDYTGVSSYLHGTGELIDPHFFGFNNTIETFMEISISQDGLYYAQAQPVNNGVTKWYLRWFQISTGLEVANATNLSSSTLKISAIGF
jgi:hypothetical protein